MADWKPISEYKSCVDGWGAEVVVELPPAKPEILFGPQPHGPRFVAHLEADMWLVRDSDDHVCWSQLETLPIKFLDIGDDWDCSAMHDPVAT
jgi:hypothetical protein